MLFFSDCLEGGNIDGVLSGLDLGFDKASLLTMVEVIILVQNTDIVTQFKWSLNSNCMNLPVIAISMRKLAWHIALSAVFYQDLSLSNIPT